MIKNRSIQGIVGITVISIIIMYILETTTNVTYLYKSLTKVLMFFILPSLYTLYDKNIKLRDSFKLKKKRDFLFSFILGIGVYMIILMAYFVLKDFIDLSNIIKALDENVNVNKNNFLWIAFYISFINSLLEEFFFRGFLFLNLRKIGGRVLAYIFSALAFLIYHIAIMGNWFSPIIFSIAIMGLFSGGLIFNYLNEKSGNLYNSWIVHIMANLGINTVGLIMFDIIN